MKWKEKPINKLEKIAGGFAVALAVGGVITYVVGEVTKNAYISNFVDDLAIGGIMSVGVAVASHYLRSLN